MQHMPRKTPSYRHEGWLHRIPINRFCTVELNQRIFIIEGLNLKLYKTMFKMKRKKALINKECTIVTLPVHTGS